MGRPAILRAPRLRPSSRDPATLQAEHGDDFRASGLRSEVQVQQMRCSAPPGCHQSLAELRAEGDHGPVCAWPSMWALERTERKLGPEIRRLTGAEHAV